MLRQDRQVIRTSGRGFTEITAAVQRFVGDSGIGQGLCNVFLAHTSASLLLCENADGDVRADLERFMQRLAPDGDPLFAHVSEGPDDMPAHVRSVLTQNSIMLPVSGGRCLLNCRSCSGLTLPVSEGRLALGTWQGLYLWEHRHHGHVRTLVLTLWGNDGDAV